VRTCYGASQGLRRKFSVLLDGLLAGVVFSAATYYPLLALSFSSCLTYSFALYLSLNG
jgi:hypothetical protein